MYKLLLIGLVAVLLSTCASMEPTVTDTEMIGLWQYKDREIWIQIDKRGRVFQCRVDFGNEAIVSKGALKENNIIKWEKIWEPSSIQLVNNSLLLDDFFGELRFDRTEEAMADECRNPLK